MTRSRDPLSAVLARRRRFRAAFSKQDQVLLALCDCIEHEWAVAKIERFIGRKIEHVKLENFQYGYTALFDANRQGDTGRQSVRGVRIKGGYFCGPVRRKRR